MQHKNHFVSTPQQYLIDQTISQNKRLQNQLIFDGNSTEMQSISECFFIRLRFHYEFDQGNANQCLTGLVS